jgi:hypothetical protein
MGNAIDSERRPDLGQRASHRRLIAPRPKRYQWQTIRAKTVAAPPESSPAGKLEAPAPQLLHPLMPGRDAGGPGRAGPSRRQDLGVEVEDPGVLQG